MVYKQPGKIFDVEHGRLSNRSMEGRGDFKTMAFAHKHRLGEPVAGNFYQVHNKSNVLEKKLAYKNSFRLNMTIIVRSYTNN